MLKNWSNTLLVAFSRTPKMLAELDHAFNSRLKSTFGSIHLKNGITTEQIIGEMLRINYFKCKICEMREAVEGALGSMDESSRGYLTDRVLKGRTFRELALSRGVSLRTAFRRFEAAELALTRALRRSGYTEERMRREFGEIPQLAAVAERLEDGNYFTVRAE